MDTNVCSNQTSIVFGSSSGPTTKQPLARSIAFELKERITQGFWKHGEQLPSVRELTRKWGVSHVTIIRALEELVSQGYIRTVSGKGSFVEGKFLESLQVERMQADFSPDASLDATFHTETNRKLYQALQKQARASVVEHRANLLADMDSLGYLPLRMAVASYLRRQRKIICTAEQIAIFQNKKVILDLLSRLLIVPGMDVLFENPANIEAKNCMLFNGANLVGCCFDEGLSEQFYSILEVHSPKLVVMSSHFVQASARRETLVEHLLNYVFSANALIIEECIEDDFCFGADISSVKSNDSGDAVIYVGVLPRLINSMSPIAFALLPTKLISPVTAAKETFGMHCSELEQRLWAHHIEDGHFERHLLRVRATSNLERAKVVSELTRQLRGICSIICPPKGTHLIINFNQEIHGDEIIQAALHVGLPLEPADRFYISGGRPAEYRLQFIGIEIEKLSQQVSEFKRLISA